MLWKHSSIRGLISEVFKGLKATADAERHIVIFDSCVPQQLKLNVISYSLISLARTVFVHVAVNFFSGFPGFNMKIKRISSHQYFLIPSVGIRKELHARLFK